MASDIIARALAIKANKTLPAISSADAGKLATVDSNGKWAAANLTVGQGEVAVDSTLLVSGAAADAKATGDEITDLKSATNNLETNANFFNPNYTIDGYGLRYSDGNIVSQTVAFITDFIPVRPGAKVVINQHLNSTSYANIFYKSDKSTIVYKYYCNADGTNLIAPENAAYIRACGILAQKSAMRVLVFDSPLLQFNTVDALEKYMLFGTNIFNSAEVSLNLSMKSDGNIYALQGGYVSYPILVKPGEIYRIENNLGSYTYCHCFFKKNGASYAKVGDAVTSIGDYNGQTGYKYIVVPQGAEYLRISGSTALISSQKITYCNLVGKDLVSYLQTVATTHGRITLKAPLDTIDGFDHAGFPSSVFFAGKQIVAARLGKQHFTPDSSSDWGGIKFFVQNPDGTWNHDRALLTAADFTGMSGELRDPNIGITRDGQYLILAGWSTYKSDGTDVHDCVIATFDSSLEIVSYKVFSQATDLFWGNALITPNGKLLVGSYNGNYAVKVNQSTSVFDPTDLSNLEFVQTQIHNSGTEVTLGYVGNKLYALVRTGSGGYLSYTSNLEGDSGWVTAVRYGNEVDAPVLPYAQPDNGRLFFGGAYYVNSNYRYPCIGYIDTSTNQLLTSGNVDSAVTGYSGYCGIVSLGGNEYGIAYYEDFGTSAALYYQRINAGYILPAMQCYV